MKILVADDDAVYCSLLERMLTQWDYQVVTAYDGQEALNILRGSDPPRLVILDWMMPQLDGFEVCRTMRQMHPEGDFYIILLTGSRQKEEIIKVLVAGADDYLLKPFDPLDLKIRLRAARRVLDLQAALTAARRWGASRGSLQARGIGLGWGPPPGLGRRGYSLLDGRQRAVPPARPAGDRPGR